MKQLLRKAEKLAISEIEIYGAPSIFNFNLSNKKGQGLANKYNADKNIVLLGTMLMDLKIGQALRENKLKYHIKMSSEAAKKFLGTEIDSRRMIQAIVHCIEAHHGNLKYKSKEAEIVANADCYRFLTISGFLHFIVDLSKEGLPFSEIIDLAREKAEEKWKIASLPEVQKELEPNYRLIKEFIKKAK